jgi:hypothetical protein
VACQGPPQRLCDQPGIAAPLAAEAGATTAPPAAAKTSGTIIHPLPGPQVFPESVAVDAASGRYWATSVKDGTLAVYRHRLLVVSSQFDTLGRPAAVSGTEPPKLPFWVSKVAAGTR